MPETKTWTKWRSDEDLWSSLKFDDGGDDDGNGDGDVGWCLMFDWCLIGVDWCLVPWKRYEAFVFFQAPWCGLALSLYGKDRLEQWPTDTDILLAWFFFSGVRLNTWFLGCSHDPLEGGTPIHNGHRPFRALQKVAARVTASTWSVFDVSGEEISTPAMGISSSSRDHGYQRPKCSDNFVSFVKVETVLKQFETVWNLDGSHRKLDLQSLWTQVGSDGQTLCGHAQRDHRTGGLHWKWTGDPETSSTLSTLRVKCCGSQMEMVSVDKYDLFNTIPYIFHTYPIHIPYTFHMIPYISHMIQVISQSPHQSLRSRFLRREPGPGLSHAEALEGRQDVGLQRRPGLQLPETRGETGLHRHGNAMGWGMGGCGMLENYGFCWKK